MIRWSLRLALVPLMLAVGLAPLAAQESQPPALKPEMRTGSHLLRALLREMKIEALRSFAEIGDRRDDVILISIGNPAWLRRREQRFLRDFVMNGGGLLVATDYDLNDAAWRPEFNFLTGVSVVDTPVVCVEDANIYDGKPELPILVPPQGGGPIQLGDKIVTSLPARLQELPAGRFQGGIRPIAYLPESSVLEQDWRGPGGLVPVLTRRERLFGVAGPRGEGRIVLLADTHLFINDLMARDIDNYDFAGAVLNYLREDGKRKRCLFIENGKIVTSFDVPLQDLSELPEEALNKFIVHIESRIAAAESRGQFQNLFWDLLRRNNIMPARLAALVALTLTILGGLYLLFRVLKARFPTESGLPRLATSLGAQVPTVGLVPQRIDEQLEHGQLHEPGRHLARTMLLAAGCVAGAPRPRVTVAGGWWQRWTVAARFRRVWLLAFGKRTVPVRPQQWPGLVRAIQSLRQAFLDGTIHLESQRAA